jgi:hypothetical protein
MIYCRFLLDTNRCAVFQFFQTFLRNIESEEDAHAKEENATCCQFCCLVTVAIGRVQVQCLNPRYEIDMKAFNGRSVRFARNDDAQKRFTRRSFLMESEQKKILPLNVR